MNNPDTNLNSTNAHALAASLAWKGITATEFKLIRGRVYGHYVTDCTDFWAAPSVIAYGQRTNLEVLQQLTEARLL